MIEVYRLGRPPYSQEVLAALQALPKPIYHPDPSLESFLQLEKAGLAVQPIPEQLTGGTLLVLPATGPSERLVQIVDRLLGPGGCPWDQEQTHASLKKYLIEEAYELFEAIDKENLAAMSEELGDVLLQPVLHAGMLRRDGKTGIDEIATNISDKLIRRHPHVFGDVSVDGVDQVLQNWDSIKKSEKNGKESVLTGVPKSLPALMRALQISKRAARQGFEWPNLEGVWQKFEEEVAELKEAEAGRDAQAMADELGDLLFTITNLARWMKIDPEEALSRMVDRFQQRFEAMERLADGPLSDLSAESWDALWNQAKLETADS